VSLQACINGTRTPTDHPRIPITPDQIAADAAAAVEAGASNVHVHPKDSNGTDTLDPDVVARVIRMLRASVPSTPIGLTTGLWAASSVVERGRWVSSWSTLPDFASINFHEEGAESLAGMLLAMGVGIEAGLSTLDAVHRWSRWSGNHATHRILLEVVDQAVDPLLHAQDLIFALGARFKSHRVLLHGLDANCWIVAKLAQERGLQQRIGLEDTLVMPDGTPAEDNAGLVRTMQF
jgi:uncharacterized protein (DUF849 family)